MMNCLLKTSVLILLLSCFCFSQEPVSIVTARWSRTVQKAQKTDVQGSGPAVALVPDHKYFQRKAREQRTDNPMDPNEATIEGRSRAIDKVVEESRTPQAADVAGYLYSAEIRNDAGKKIDVIFWEYRFTEIANPANVIRRQFVCAASMKKGATRELSAFSSIGPSDAIDVDSLAKPNGQLFQEKVVVNRIEFADGDILQRDGWKFADVKAGVDRATSTPWGNEVCRML